MRIEQISNQNFGQITSAIPYSQFGSRAYSKVVKCLQSQLNNPVLTELYMDTDHRMTANIYIKRPYYVHDGYYKKGFLQTKIGFLKKICKLSDDVNQKCENAKMRYEMLENSLNKSVK